MPSANTPSVPGLTGTHSSAFAPVVVLETFRDFRDAVARGEIRLQRTTLSLIQKNSIAKGNVLAAARLAEAEIVARLRGETRFASVDALHAQIARDVVAAREVL